MGNLDTNEYWYYHRCFLCLLHQETTHDVSELIFYIIQIQWVHALGMFLNGALDEDAGLRQELLIFPKIDKASRDDVW